MKQSLERTIHEANWSYLTILGVAQGGKEDKRGKVEFVAVGNTKGSVFTKLVLEFFYYKLIDLGVCGHCQQITDIC